jgi:TPR repeat protein
MCAHRGRQVRLPIAVAPHLLLVPSIIWAIPMVLLLCGCSRQETAQAKSPHAERAQSADSGNTLAPAVREEAVGPLSLVWDECSPEASAAFERLVAVHTGDRGSVQASKDLSALTQDCEAGDWAVCNGLGIVFGEGHGVEPDLAKGMEYFRRACDGGLATGCLNLSVLHASGTGVRKDLSEAASFLEKACGLGNVIACENLAIAYASGRGVAKDFAKAASFYEKACDGGWSPGCTNLAGLYSVGAGVEKDAERAKAYYAKACDLGSKNACAAAKR